MHSFLLKQYLQNPRSVIYAKLDKFSIEDGADVFHVTVDVDIPQRPIYKINKSERIEIRFRGEDQMPGVYSLRKNFPRTPHLIQGNKGSLTQFCLYERAWSDEKENWSPRSFIERIRHWLARTADGTLHPNDQALEPVLLHGIFTDSLVLPEIALNPDKLCRIERFYFYKSGNKYLVAFREMQKYQDKSSQVPVLIVRGPVVTHGLIYEIPRTLSDLERLLGGLGGALIQTLSQEIEKIHFEIEACRDKVLIIIIELPKKREINGVVEFTERHAFLVENPVELFAKEKGFVKNESILIPKNKRNYENVKYLSQVQIHPASVRNQLTPTFSAKLNGFVQDSRKILAIGVGSIGSQVINNLLRGGFGNWTLIDDDILEPHNPSRHLLSSNYVGCNKAKAVAENLNLIFPEAPPLAFIPCNFLNPSDHESELNKAMESSDLVIDFSASVAVERKLSLRSGILPRIFSVFLNQRGDESVILAQDNDRSFSPFWLEAVYLHAIYSNIKMSNHFDVTGRIQHRYGNGCRDTSSTISQDSIAIHSGLLAHHIRRVSSNAEPKVIISRWSPSTSEVKVVDVELVNPIKTTIANWKLFIDPRVINKMKNERLKHLPNETGGILLGVVDRNSSSIAIIDTIIAPIDSESWPTSFIRGKNNLSHSVEKIVMQTLGNVIYVGEWHSHPNHCDAKPSHTDLKALEICSPHMSAEALPVLMLIAASNEIRVVLKPTSSDKTIDETISD